MRFINFNNYLFIVTLDLLRGRQRVHTNLKNNLIKVVYIWNSIYNFNKYKYTKKYQKKNINNHYN